MLDYTNILLYNPAYMNKKSAEFGEMLKNFRQYFVGPSKDLVKYLIKQNIMTPTQIAKEMGISRETLYNKYIND